MRLVFETKDKFVKWIGENCNFASHACYVTNDNEFIIVPKRSTAPVVYAYYKTTNPQDYVIVMQEIQRLVNITRVKDLEWTAAHFPGFEKILEQQVVSGKGRPPGAWRSDPITPDQLKTLQDLGAVPKAGITKGEAHDVITKLISLEHRSD